MTTARKVLTAVVRMSPAQIRQKFGDLLASFERDAKMRRPSKMPDCTAIQHPRLNELGQDGIVTVCAELRVPLVFVDEADPFA